MTGAAKIVRLLKYGLEHRLQVARRRIDDLQNCRGGGLLFECLARLGEEPRTGDHRLSIGTITVGPRMTAVGGRRRFRSFD